MFRTARNAALSALFILAMGACGTGGGCASCSSVEPLPAGGLPVSQTIEGGAQLRVTPHGFATLTSILPGLLADQLGAGFCLPGDDFVGGIVSYCKTNQGGCTNGCKLIPTLNNVSIAPNAASSLRMHVDAKATATVPLHIVAGTCDIAVKVDHLVADVDVALGTNPTTGELTITTNPITSFSFSGDSFTAPSGFPCNLISGLAGLVVNLLQSTVEDFVKNLLSPAIQNIIPSFLPNPLGLVGKVDLGSLLPGLSPGAGAKLETRLIPGFYAKTTGGGLSIGVITGINADANPATRAPGLDSEPARCVPALSAPNLGAAPSNLTKTSRSSYKLDPVPAFDGQDPPAGANADLAVGISEATLDLLGHHVVTSGALCLGVGTELISQLNVGTISLLVPSLTQLVSGTGKDPLLLVTRPQHALGFTIGDNTDTSPAITINVDHLEADFYAFLYERYVRVFTVDLSLNVGINLALEQAAGGPTTIKPTLLGITADKVKVTVLNSEFVSESAQQLEAVLPSVFSLVTPLIGDLPEITLPGFAGFELDNLAIQHVTSGGQNFLEIYGALKASAGLRRAATRNPLLGTAVTALDARRPAVAAAPSTGHARLAGVTAPAPDVVRSALQHVAGGALPQVAFDVDQVDASGRPLEWAYQLDGGMWRPWRAGPLVIADPAFVWQGKYTIGLKSRVAGDYHTVSETALFPVIIDSVAPQIAADKAAWNGDTFEISAFDIVSERNLTYAFGRPGSAKPESPWVQGGTAQLGRDAARAYAVDGKVAVFVKDEAGNTAVAVVAPTGGPDTGGCAAASAPGAGGLLLMLVVGGLVIVRRRGVRRRAGQPRTGWLRRRSLIAGVLWLGGAAIASLQPACSCNNNAAQPTTCEVDTDCRADACGAGELPFCVDSMCVCSDDIPPGRIGPYSHVAVGPDGAIWVSAYAQSHGDLVVAKTTGGRIADSAWEWVDGVPDGPIVVPGATVRGGIADPGPDVGMYTSIAVAPDGTPMVAYFDRDTASLKLAQKINGAWQIHVVEAGTGKLDGATGQLVGMYTSITLRADDGRPGIAYLAHVKDAAGTHAEVRFASAQSVHPSAATDWQTWTVDSAPLPADDPMNPEVFPLPAGLGLFIASARMPDQSPVVAYYDRANGDLKLAKFNVKAGQFSPARVLDGSTTDAGWTPSVAVDAKGVVNIAYSGLTGDNLKLVTDASGASAQVIDDGYRIDGTTVDGLPKPNFHFVGDNATLVLPTGGGAPSVVYQDATTQELLLAQQGTDGTWSHSSIAGATDPWPGGYGFYASAAVGTGQLVMSTWVVNLPESDGANSNWVEVFSRPIQ